MEGIEVARHILCREVEKELGIDGFSRKTGFKMQVRTETAPGVASQADGLAGTHLLVGGNELLGQVAVDGFEAVGMAHHDVIAIAALIVAHYADFAVEGGHDGVAGIDLDVKTFMYTFESGTVTETRGDVARGSGHTKAAQVNHEAVGHFFALVGVCLVGDPGVIQFAAQVVEFHVALHGTLNGYRVHRTQAAVNRCLTGNQILC